MHYSEDSPMHRTCENSWIVSQDGGGTRFKILTIYKRDAMAQQVTTEKCTSKVHVVASTAGDMSSRPVAQGRWTRTHNCTGAIPYNPFRLVNISASAIMKWMILKDVLDLANGQRFAPWNVICLSSLYIKIYKLNTLNDMWYLKHMPTVNK